MPDDPFAGLGGLSMFLVPTYEEDGAGKRNRIVKISRLEEKLGHHGSATAALLFDRAPGGRGIERHAAAGDRFRIEVAQDHVGIGRGRAGAPCAVAHGSRIGTGALGADLDAGVRAE